MKNQNYSNQDDFSSNFSGWGNFTDPQEEIQPTGRKKTKKNWLKIIGKIFLWLILLFLLVGLAYGAFFVYKIDNLGRKIIINNSNDKQSFLEIAKSLVTKNPIKLRGYENGQINILLLGIAGKGKPGQNLTDTLMLASVNTKTNQIALLSIPRDLFINAPGYVYQGKINSLYQYGLSNSKNDQVNAIQSVADTVFNITSLKTDYYVVLNFKGFEKIIDSIGGINVMNENDIYDANYPGPNYSREIFELKKGFQQLDGATALKYARERHDDPQGDFGRAKRQQQIMQSAKNKIFSAGTLLNVFSLNQLFDALGENIITNIKPEEIGNFYELSKKLDTQNINNVVLDAWNKDSLLMVSHVFYKDIRAFVLMPRIGNYSEIQDLAKNIFDLNKIKRRREEIQTENSGIILIDRSGDFKIINRIKKVLTENLAYKNVTIAADSSKIISKKSIAYDLTNGAKPFTLDEIVTKLPAAAAYEIPADIKKIAADRQVDIVVTVGKDLIDRYNMEEDTIQDLNNARDSEEDLQLNKQ